MARPGLTITVQYRFTAGDVVHYNHGGETFTVQAQRHTRSPCTVDRIEYLLETPAGQFWALERDLTLHESRETTHAGLRGPQKGTRSMHTPPKPFCTLMGTDGNVFAVLGKVLTALRQAHQHAQAEDVQARFFWCKSYDEAVQLFLEYVSIT